MSMTKMIEIDGREVAFRASAAIPRIYRLKFQRDIYKDLSALEKAVGKEDEGNSNLDLFSLEMFENIAYVMAKHAENDMYVESRNDACPEAYVELATQAGFDNF